jgi:nitrate/nitrite-specific signal transduction histidine kinase
MDKFERLKVISSLFQQKCWKKEIFSGRDENSLKSQYKLSANGINNRPGLRLTYIPQEALEMFEKHITASAVEVSATPAFAIINTPLRSATPRLI